MEKGILEHVRANMKHREHLAKSLLNSVIPRITFDAANLVHRRAYVKFTETGRWELNFRLEPPFRNVIHMIERRLIAYALTDD